MVASCSGSHLALRQAVGAQDARQLDLVLNGAILVEVPEKAIPARPQLAY